nr:transcription factor MYB97-like [Arachis hypogaea]
MLIEYVKKWGERNWNFVQRNSELRRSDRSCKRRWLEHLRPDLKKGPLSEEEEKLIVDLHAQFGNKWALIATKVPGRSGNEIKCFCETRMKKRPREWLAEDPPQMLQQVLHKLHHRHLIRASSTWSLPQCKSGGLLNDVVMEGNDLCPKGKSNKDAPIVIGKEEEELADKRKIIEEPPLPPIGTSKEEETATIIATQSSSHQLISTEKNDNGGCNNNKEALNNSMHQQVDNELLNILKNTPLAIFASA